LNAALLLDAARRSAAVPLTDCRDVAHAERVEESHEATLLRGCHGCWSERAAFVSAVPS